MVVLYGSTRPYSDNIVGVKCRAKRHTGRGARFKFVNLDILSTCTSDQLLKLFDGVFDGALATWDHKQFYLVPCLSAHDFFLFKICNCFSIKCITDIILYIQRHSYYLHDLISTT